MLLAGFGVFFYLQQIHAQTVPVETPPPSQPQPSVTGVPGAPGTQAAAPAPLPPPTPAEPVYDLKGVVASGIKAMNVKNWDGTVTDMLRFKYKSMSGRTMTIHLPGVYKDERRTRAGWNTLFTCYAMDYEAMLDEIAKNKPPDVSAFMSEFMAEIRGEVPEGTFDRTPAGVSEARDVIQHYVPGMGVGDLALPPLFTGM